ncbi:MAG: phosphoribosylglycinamide formyltransferase [Bacteroidetes bacterium]|nr:phosphoribosylglycinamide formyltransferase [Bacteroidota bacterium]
MGFYVAVFASGGGSNFQALADHAIEYSVELLVTNRPNVGALQRAERLEIPAQVIVPASYKNEELYSKAVIQLLEQQRIDLIALAGYLSKIPAQLIHDFSGPILNIHPSLLPRFGGKGLYGKHVHQAVIDAKETTSGATVHIVDEEYDTGPIILQESIPVLGNDTPDSLALRVLNIEHQLYPKVINLFAQKRVKLTGRHATILPSLHDH